MKTLARFFWDHEYPARSFMRIFVVLSVGVYLWGRLSDPGPTWAQAMIQTLIQAWNLEFIQSIGLLGKASPTFWRGSGFALQMQLLITWPVMWVFALTAGWMCRNGSKNFVPELMKPPIPQRPTMKDWLANFGVLAFILAISYFPFRCSDVARHYIPSGLSRSIGLYFDSPMTCVFWIFVGCWQIYVATLMLLVIKTEYHLTFYRGDCHD